MRNDADRLLLLDHDLGDGCLFRVGRLPDCLLWDDETFAAVWASHPTEKHRILMPGGPVETPRWQQAYGADYHYTGSVNKALAVPSLLIPLLAWARAQVEPQLNGVLVNWYDGPSHYIGPHHDSVKNMVVGSPIVTVSFGETRTFRLTLGKGEDKKTRDFPAPAGTVFVMPYDTNLVWKHAVPKSTRYTGRRISVTFRAFENQGATPTE